MKCIAYRTKENNLCILYPVLNRGLSLEEIIAKDVRADIYHIMESESLPSEPIFSRAWELEGGVVKVNLEKAKEIWKDVWRHTREPILKKLDLEWMRALEIGDVAKTSEVFQKKKELRDVTNINLDSIFTPEDLKNFWPSCLS
jgi:hypothetical protein